MMFVWKNSQSRTRKNNQTSFAAAPATNIRQTVCADCLALNLNKMYLRLLNPAVTTLSASATLTSSLSSNLVLFDVVVQRQASNFPENKEKLFEKT